MDVTVNYIGYINYYELHKHTQTKCIPNSTLDPQNTLDDSTTICQERKYDGKQCGVETES